MPKSSASSSVSTSAAQLTATNGPLDRELWWWISRATSSFPDPLSPFTSTVKLVVAIWPISCRRRTIDGLVPMSGDASELRAMADGAVALPAAET